MNKIFNLILCSLSILNVNAQSIDKIEAIVGDEILLTSDIESQYLQYLGQGNVRSEAVKCELIQDLLFQKLLINQAKSDSIKISDEEIEVETSKRLSYFENQLGSIEKVEAYFNKSKNEINIELANVVKNQFLAQRIQKTITNDITITPVEVNDFFANLNEADIPFISTQLEISQIIIKPEISSIKKDEIINKLNSFRERVYKGEDFKMLATLYSDDVGSASKGGELGFVNRGDLVPEFERAAFKLKAGEISEVVESQYGYHIIQLIERRGEQINVRHILLKLKVSSTQLYKAKLKIDKISEEIKNKEITFDEAIQKYSDDESKNNSGLLLNPTTMSTKNIIEDMSPSLQLILEDLSSGDISEPAIMKLANETDAYRILRVNNRIDAHKANLEDDFSLIKEMALNFKKQQEQSSWINKTIDRTYIKINDNISDCNFNNKWKK